MNIQFTQEELNNLIAFLNRVQLTGAEADVLVMLKMKLRTALERVDEPAAEPSGT